MFRDLSHCMHFHPLCSRASYCVQNSPTSVICFWQMHFS